MTIMQPMLTPFYFGTNLKMNQTPDEAHAFVSQIAQSLTPNPQSPLQLWLTPSFTNIAAVAGLCQQHNIWLGGQTMHWASDGAYTGEISAVQLKSAGANLVMLGHAERRTLFGETDEAIHKKVLAAQQHGLRVMLCVGETAFEKQFDTGHEFVSRQLKIALRGMQSPDETASLLVLYEPVWSVGPGGVPADPAYVAAALANIRRILHQLFGGAGTQVPILYGGSVNATNCADYAHLPNCVGLGVGRAAWQADHFLTVLNASFC